MNISNKNWHQDELESLFIGLNSDNKYEREYAVKVGVAEGFVEDNGHLNEVDFKKWLFKKIFNKEPKELYPTEVLNLLDSEDKFKQSIALDRVVKTCFGLNWAWSKETYRKEIKNKIERIYDPSIHNVTKEEFYNKLNIEDKEGEKQMKIINQRIDDEYYLENYGMTEKELNKKERAKTIKVLTITILSLIGLGTVYNWIKDALN